MEALEAGVASAIVGAAVGVGATLVGMRPRRSDGSDALAAARLATYQRLFHLTGRLPRYWPAGTAPSRQEIDRLRREFHDVYFAEDNPAGMYLTEAAKARYMNLQNALAAVADLHGDDRGGPTQSPLTTPESKALRDAARDLRHQLVADLGSANPRRGRNTRPANYPPPPNVDRA